MWVFLFFVALHSPCANAMETESDSLDMASFSGTGTPKKEATSGNPRPHSPLDQFTTHYRRDYGSYATSCRIDRKQGAYNFKAAIHLLGHSYERLEDESDALAIAGNLLVSAPMYGYPAAYVPQAQILMRPLLKKYEHLPANIKAQKLQEDSDWTSAKYLLKLAINENHKHKTEPHLQGWAHLALSFWYAQGRTSLKYNEKERFHRNLALHYGLGPTAMSSGDTSEEAEDDCLIFKDQDAQVEDLRLLLEPIEKLYTMDDIFETEPLFTTYR